MDGGWLIKIGVKFVRKSVLERIENGEMGASHHRRINREPSMKQGTAGRLNVHQDPITRV
jgi:hypothetical protein